MSDLGDRLRANKPLEKGEQAWRAWSVVERDLKLRSYRDGDPLDDVFVVTPVERAHRAETRLGDVKAELSIAREALEDALEGLRDMIAYVPEQFQEKWEHPGYVERAEAVLARLQAKEEGA